MFRRRNVPSINSVYEAISQPHLLQTTIQFIFKYQTSFSRLFLAWWSSDDIAASDWSAWPQGALWLAADYWPSWSLMSALSAPEDVTWSRSAPIGNIDMSRHKNRTGAILRGRWSTRPCEWYEYDDLSRCAVWGQILWGEHNNGIRSAHNTDKQ